MESHHQNLAQIIETDQLQALIDAKTPNLRILDATWTMQDKPLAEKTFGETHIPGA